MGDSNGKQQILNMSVAETDGQSSISSWWNRTLLETC